MKNNLIVHLIQRDKFTTGYINFMKLRMTEYEHHFFTRDIGFELKPVDFENIHYYHDDREILRSDDNLKLLNDCGKIIISGIWYRRLLFIMPLELIRKSYPHFWGGDFYSWRFNRMPRNPIRVLKWLVHRHFQYRLVKNCAGTINLIEDDIKQLQKIFPNNAKNFVAQMPNDVLEHEDFNSLIARKKENATIRILAGNSAQRPNEHDGIFEKLKHFRNYDIEIVSPLSYGESKYREHVIKLGRDIFGEKFKPIIDFIPKEKYAEFLSSFDVGVFNQNQQAALGNIWLLMRLGKKIFIRENTAMWNDFKNKGAFMYPISEVSRLNLEELVYLSEECRQKNIQIAQERMSGLPAVKEWSKVLGA